MTITHRAIRMLKLQRDCNELVNDLIRPPTTINVEKTRSAHNHSQIRDNTKKPNLNFGSHREGIFISFDPRIKSILEQAKDRTPITHEVAKGVLSSLAKNPKRLPGHAGGSDTPATIRTAEVKMIAESDKWEPSSIAVTFYIIVP
ncbi:unnamed protein product [Clonostachys rosea f. rosea IK726]|uniref:Uncharacterized protein n=1 Tax=Clonostachys rosea f. rosea IK726 TaxID=1349383 RepID=A0ACA9TC05_BIOOC|nr:unnamed protein product [Clonostachys rosea f. rosea IK726]